MRYNEINNNKAADYSNQEYVIETMAADIYKESSVSGNKNNFHCWTHQMDFYMSCVAWGTFSTIYWPVM